MTVTSRWQVFFHSLAFVIGFSLVFITLGASVAFVGYALNAFLPTFVKVGGVILIVFGLQISGVLGWLGDRVRSGRPRPQPGRAEVTSPSSAGSAGCFTPRGVFR